MRCVADSVSHSLIQVVPLMLEKAFLGRSDLPYMGDRIVNRSNRRRRCRTTVKTAPHTSGIVNI
eukprot:58343-Pleurochrysis_carterae.AAC.1